MVRAGGKRFNGWEHAPFLYWRGASRVPTICRFTLTELSILDSRCRTRRRQQNFTADGQLFQEKDPPPRFYVKLGTGYIAFGGNATVSPSIDHFCALVENYQPQEMRKSLEAAGVTMGPAPFGMALDPDGLRLQLLRVPGGLAKTIIPAYRLSQDDALFEAVAPDHVMLHVADLDKSAEHYKKVFGSEMSRTKKPERIWFGAARTKLGLELVAAGEKPSIHHICVRVAGFEKKLAMEKLKRADVESMVSDEGLVRFRDPNGIVMELKGEA